jgi:hypothetical protein
VCELGQCGGAGQTATPLGPAGLASPSAAPTSVRRAAAAQYAKRGGGHAVCELGQCGGAGQTAAPLGPAGRASPSAAPTSVRRAAAALYAKKKGGGEQACYM